MPRSRTKTGINTNPMDGIFRNAGEREVTSSPTDLRRLLKHASYQVRLVIAIAAAAPKLRLANILSLEWGVNIDHESAVFSPSASGRPCAKDPAAAGDPDAQLRNILDEAFHRNGGTHVVVSRAAREEHSRRYRERPGRRA